MRAVFLSRPASGQAAEDVRAAVQSPAEVETGSGVAEEGKGVFFGGIPDRGGLRAPQKSARGDQPCRARQIGVCGDWGAVITLRQKPARGDTLWNARHLGISGRRGSAARRLIRARSSPPERPSGRHLRVTDRLPQAQMDEVAPPA